MKGFLIVMLTVLICGLGCAQSSNNGYISQNNSEFAKTIADKNIQLIDVRTAQEFASGHIVSATNIDVNGVNFDKMVETLDKNRPVAVYCRSGNRSKKAARRLVEKGFKVYELNNGLMNWDGKIEK